MSFREEMEKEEREPDFIFHMDGSAHYKEEETRCCGSFGKKCKCGGFMHYQPVYGGYYYKCEVCLIEE
jgi:predicted  nucleic acid-binding Zn ribbon protein